MHQEHQAVRPCLLELFELPHGRITLRASSFDVPACQLVILRDLLGSVTMGIADLSLQLLDAMLELLDSKLEAADAIGRDHALGDDMPCLFFVSLAKETHLVVHG